MGAELRREKRSSGPPNMRGQKDNDDIIMLSKFLSGPVDVDFKYFLRRTEELSIQGTQEETKLKKLGNMLESTVITTGPMTN